MTRSEFLFVAIDVIFHPAQNYRRYKDIKVSEDFCYDNNFPKECLAEYYYDPKLLETGKKMPVIVNFHGGGFVAGDKKHRVSLCKRYASHGYFVVNANYRLAPKYSFPALAQDAVKAVNYLENTAKSYNIDLDKVVVTGDSSGAYLASEYTAIACNEDLCKKLECDKVKIKPALLLSWCGVYDFEKSITLTKLPFNMVWDIGRCEIDNDGFHLNKDFSNMKDFPLLKEASPINWINKDWCTSYLVMSKKDVFCKGQGELLAEKLNELGIKTQVFHSTKVTDNHCFHMDMYKSISKKVFKEVFEFMEDYFKEEEIGNEEIEDKIAQ
ncbi:MAG: alpha/beta hydrolase fold domain-containing protein [Clostridia bacterium]